MDNRTTTFDTSDTIEFTTSLLKRGYFGDNRPIKKDVYRKRRAMTILSGDDSHTILQGGCYIPQRDHFVMAFVNSDFNSTIVVELDRDYETVIKRVQLDIGHANDFTYNPMTNKIYVATGNTGTNANKIAVLNAETFALEETMTLGDTRGKWLCSYDEINNQYYVIDNLYIRVFDGNWTLLKTFDNTLKDNYVGDIAPTLTAQSSFCYKGQFITIYFSRVKVGGAQRISGIYLQLVNTDNGETETVARYIPRGNSDEPEFVAMIDDVGYMFGGQTYFSVSKIYMDQSKIYETDYDLFGAGLLLPENADLDDYQMPGMYYSPNTAYTESLSNAPVATGFTLYVLPVCGNVTVQKLISSAGDVYKRVLSSTTNAFLDWELIDSCVGSRFRKDGQSSTHTVSINKNGAWMVMFPYGDKVNMYLISDSNGTVYARTISEGISATISMTKGEGSVTFRCSLTLGMLAWRLA